MADAISHAVSQLNQSSLWATHNPRTCECGGDGWLNSAYDTWHECHIHGGTPHPEDDDPDFDWEAHRVKCLENALAVFKAYCEREGVECDEGEGDLEARMYKAEEAAYEAHRARLDKEARELGYSCHSERMWASL